MILKEIKDPNNWWGGHVLDFLPRDVLVPLSAGNDEVFARFLATDFTSGWSGSLMRERWNADNDSRLMERLFQKT